MLDDPEHGTFPEQRSRDMSQAREQSGIDWYAVNWRLSDYQLARRLGVTPGVVKKNRERVSFNLWMKDRNFVKTYPYKSGGKAYGFTKVKPLPS